jgi:hypothetical protein
MHLSGFEPTIPMFERAKTLYALDRAATVISNCNIEPRILYHIDPFLSKDFENNGHC